MQPSNNVHIINQLQTHAGRCCLQVGLKLPQQRHPAYGVVRSTIRDGNDQDDLTDGVDQVRYSGQCFLLLLCCTVLLLGSFYW